MMALTVALAVLVGLSLGLLGGGGSILTVPLLAYVGGLDTKQAIASSLLVVGVTSAVGAIAHGRAGRVRWGVTLPFGAAAMTGALGGGVVARFIPGTALLISLAVIMIAAGGAMLRGRRNTNACDEVRRVPLVKMAVLGVAVGGVSGLVGAGGGFLLVPALAVLAGLPMAAAVGTSLVVIAMQSFAGLTGHLASGHVDWPLAAMVTAAAVVGALIGARLSGAVDADALRTLFGWFVLLMASVILAQETTPAVGAASAALIMIGVGTYVTCRRTAYCPLRRLIPRVQPAAAA
ncbi:sulfite exporter TauE/SafE family protein [Mycobacterium sp. 29Ha]|uniref:sulfite exporter TauE/SafE family protein n=1 Tax=Mycobacterium sp. 29Ha TaxID=2939268 RepID=UPI002938F060|nr:sulfite exporter TauE/SafE family protein [Mycobacterium sp. 29Ha]MDV3131339.1 sulfite exporter TauE/SafE family protein [Mycobacterium sp. 29Ha]